MKYGFNFQKFGELDPQVVGEHLDSLIEKYKEHLTAEEILADARKAPSPIHDAFEWNEGKAAEAHRRKQAKDLMKGLVIIPPRGSRKGKTRAFVFVHHAEHGKKVIMNLRSVMTRPEFRDQYLEEAVRGFDRWAARYAGIPGIRFAKRDITRLREKLRAELLAATGA